MHDDPRPGSRAYFDAMLKQMKELYWDVDPAYVGLTVARMGKLNTSTALNRLGKDNARTTPPSVKEVTAIEVTVWDNWAYNGGTKPSERKKEPNYDKARYKVEIEVFDQPEGVAMFGGGNAAPNSIYRGTAIAFDQGQLLKYLADKREGKRIKQAWKDDAELSAWADELEAMTLQYPETHMGPLCWTANKKAFNRGMGVIVEHIGDAKQMRATVLYPDGAHQFTRWTTRATGGRIIKSGDGHSIGLQCRATNRPDQSTWRNAKIV